MSSGHVVLAQAASAGLIAAACDGMGVQWNSQEQRHTAARTREEARAAAEPLLAVCVDCPITRDCAAWAALDQYTGIAAGTAWVNGLQRSPFGVRGKPARKAG